MSFDIAIGEYDTNALRLGWRSVYADILRVEDAVEKEMRLRAWREFGGAMGVAWTKVGMV